MGACFSKPAPVVGQNGIKNAVLEATEGRLSGQLVGETVHGDNDVALPDTSPALQTPHMQGVPR